MQEILKENSNKKDSSLVIHRNTAPALDLKHVEAHCNFLGLFELSKVTGTVMVVFHNSRDRWQIHSYVISSTSWDSHVTP